MKEAPGRSPDQPAQGLLLDWKQRGRGETGRVSAGE